MNCAVAALRRGTLRTAKPIPREWLEQEFVPEDPDHRQWELTPRRMIVVGIYVLGAAICCFGMRKRPGRLMGLGAAALVLAAGYLILIRPLRDGLRDVLCGFAAAGGLLLAVGAILKGIHRSGTGSPS